LDALQTQIMGAFVIYPTFSTSLVQISFIYDLSICIAFSFELK